MGGSPTAPSLGSLSSRVSSELELVLERVKAKAFIFFFVAAKFQLLQGVGVHLADSPSQKIVVILA